MTAASPAHVVLLVDDQPMVGALIRRILQQEPDLELHYCQDPMAAPTIAEQIRPSVILVDLRMPDLDGLALTRCLRAVPTTAGVPIVVLSSYEGSDIKSDAFAAGANDFLVKLPGREELLARLRYHSGAYLASLERDEIARALQASQDALVRANTELRHVNRKLNAFVGMAAHDLRTPLGSILSLSRFLAQAPDATRSAEHVVFLTAIRSSAEFMLQLVGDLVDASAIDAGELRLEKRSVDPAALVRVSLLLNRPLAAARGVDVALEVGDDPGAVLADADKLRQVLDTLIANAVEYSPHGATVTVRLHRTDDEVRLAVADRGPGIPASEIPALFRATGRTSVRPAGAEGSTGLGLLIAQRVVTGHGGRIWVESTVGDGSTFHVALPAAAARAGEAAAMPASVGLA